MLSKIKLLVIEDSEDDYELLIREIRKGGYSVDAVRVETLEDLEGLLDDNWDLVITDNRLPRLNAPTVLNATRAVNKEVPFFIVSGTIGEEAAVDAMRAGANDYILKGNLKRLIPAIERELKEANNRLKTQDVEKKLAKSQKMYQFLSGSIEDVFLALDEKLNIIHWNGAAEKEFQIEDRQITGENIFKLFPEWKCTDIEAKIIHVKRKSKSEHLSFQAGGEYYDGSIYPSEGGISIIVRKVTEKMRAEENLKKINNELETLMYRISHDLKGPVASIMGLINIGRMDFSDVAVQNYLGMLDKSTFQLKNTLDELLNLARIKQGQIVAEHVLLDEVIRDILEGLKYYDGFDEVDLYLNIDSTHTVYNDRRLLTSIFQNLLENAIKYRGKRRYEKSWVIISAERKEDALCVQIADNGQGIAEKQQTKVFDMFYRAHEYSSGSGLGLYIVKNAIEKIEGSISLQSQINEGCKFDVLVPDWN